MLRQRLFCSVSLRVRDVEFIPSARGKPSGKLPPGNAATTRERRRERGRGGGGGGGRRGGEERERGEREREGERGLLYEAEMGHLRFISCRRCFSLSHR